MATTLDIPVSSLDALKKEAAKRKPAVTIAPPGYSLDDGSFPRQGVMPAMVVAPPGYTLDDEGSFPQYGYGADKAVAGKGAWPARPSLSPQKDKQATGPSGGVPGWEQFNRNIGLASPAPATATPNLTDKRSLTDWVRDFAQFHPDSPRDPLDTRAENFLENIARTALQLGSQAVNDPLGTSKQVVASFIPNAIINVAREKYKKDVGSKYQQALQNLPADTPKAIIDELSKRTDWSPEDIALSQSPNFIASLYHGFATAPVDTLAQLAGQMGAAELGYAGLKNALAAKLPVIAKPGVILPPEQALPAPPSGLPPAPPAPPTLEGGPVAPKGGPTVPRVPGPSVPFEETGLGGGGGGAGPAEPTPAETPRSYSTGGALQPKETGGLATDPTAGAGTVFQELEESLLDRVARHMETLDQLRRDMADMGIPPEDHPQLIQAIQQQGVDAFAKGDIKAALEAAHHELLLERIVREGRIGAPREVPAEAAPVTPPVTPEGAVVPRGTSAPELRPEPAPQPPSVPEPTPEKLFTQEPPPAAGPEPGLVGKVARRIGVGKARKTKTKLAEREAAGQAPLGFGEPAEQPAATAPTAQAPAPIPEPPAAQPEPPPQQPPEPAPPTPAMQIPLYEMSPQELDDAYEEAKKHDKNVVVGIFGAAGAKKYERLQKTANGTSPKADAASAEIQKMEDALTDEQRNKLFGIGETGHSLEDLKDFRDALHAVDASATPGELARNLKYALGRYHDPSIPPDKLNTEQQKGYAELRHGFVVAKTNGWDANAIIKEAIGHAASRYPDPEDAYFILEKAARAVMPQEAAAPEPAPEQQWKESEPEHAFTPASEVKPALPPVVAAPEPIYRAAELAQQMAEMRKRKPSSIAKRFGANGPTPEQRTAYEDEVRAWNREYNRLSRQQKVALEEDNKKFREEQAATEPPPVPALPLTSPVGPFKIARVKGATQPTWEVPDTNISIKLAGGNYEVYEGDEYIGWAKALEDAKGIARTAMEKAAVPPQLQMDLEPGQPPPPSRPPASRQRPNIVLRETLPGAKEHADKYVKTVSELERMQDELVAVDKDVTNLTQTYGQLRGSAPLATIQRLHQEMDGLNKRRVAIKSHLGQLERDYLDLVAADPNVGEMRLDQQGNPTLYLNRTAMGVLQSVTHARQDTAMKGVELSIPEARWFKNRIVENRPADPNQQKVTPAVLRLLDAAMARAPGSIVVVGKMGEGIQGAIGTMREELLHRWQRSRSADGLHGTHLPDSAFMRLFYAMPNEMFDYLRNSGYDHDPTRGGTQLYVIEAAAKIMAGKWRRMGLTADQAAHWLRRYYDEVIQQHGPEAITEVKHTHGIAREVQQEVEKQYGPATGAAAATPTPADTGRTLPGLPAGGRAEIERDAGADAGRPGRAELEPTEVPEAARRPIKTFVSPNVFNLKSVEDAQRRLDSMPHKLMRQESKWLLGELGSQVKPRSATGIWTDGAEDTLVHEFPPDTDPDLVSYHNAIMAQAGWQKFLLNFFPHEEGNDLLYRLNLSKSAGGPNNISSILAKYGIEASTILPEYDGHAVFIATTGEGEATTKRAARQAVEELGGKDGAGAELRRTRGRSEYVGDDDRDRAGQVFQRIIDDQENLHPEWREARLRLESRPDFMELRRLVREVPQPELEHATPFVAGIHGSRKPDLTIISTEHYGSGPQRGAEMARAKKFPELFVPRSYFRLEGTHGEPFYESLPEQYKAIFNRESLYDIRSDPRKLFDEIPDKERQRGAGFTYLEKLIKDKGYHGLFDSETGEIVAFKGTPVEERLKKGEIKLPEPDGGETPPSRFALERAAAAAKRYDPKETPGVSLDDVIERTAAAEPLARAIDETLERLQEEMKARDPETLKAALQNAEPGTPLDDIIDNAKNNLAWEDLERHMLPEEREAYRDNHDLQRKIVQTANMMPNIEEWNAATKAGMIGSLWYERSSRAFDALIDTMPDTFKKKDKEKFINFIAALSPVQTVRLNLVMAINLWDRWNKAGRPQDVKWTDQKNFTGVKNKKAKLYRIMKGGELEDVEERKQQGLFAGQEPSGPARKRKTRGVDLESRLNNAIRALQGEPLSGPKVSAFAPNLGENVDKSTNDTWMAVFANLDPSVINQKHNYDAVSAMVRMAAAEHGIPTRQAQAAIWSFIKTLAEMSGWGKNRWIPPQEVINNNWLTPDLVSLHSADFADLLRNDPDIRSKIAEIGGDLRVLDRKLKRKVPAKPAADQGAAKESAEHLLGPASRLEAVRQDPKASRHLAYKSDTPSMFVMDEYGVLHGPEDLFRKPNPIELEALLAEAEERMPQRMNLERTLNDPNEPPGVRDQALKALRRLRYIPLPNRESDVPAPR